MFKNSSEFSLHIEDLKISQGFDSYIETLTHYYENETDHEFDEIIKMLNKKIIDQIEVEAQNSGLLKGFQSIVRLE